MTLDEYFGDQADSRLLFDALHSLINTLGETTCRVTQSQIPPEFPSPFFTPQTLP